MKALGFIVIGLMYVSSAFAGAPDQDKCNQPANLAKLEKSVVHELRSLIDRLEKGAHLYSFHFSPVWRYKTVSDMSVYFEKVSDDGKDRRGFTAQYSVDAKSCAPKVLKMQAMFTDQENPNGIETASPVPERCNDRQGLAQLHSEIQASLQDLYSKINPGENTENYAFSGVNRVAGATDMMVFFERTRTGLLSTPMFAQISVDPETCKPSMQEATTSTWLLITY